MTNIETRVLSRLLMSFSKPDSGDGENLSAAEMLTVIDIAEEFSRLDANLMGLFKATHAVADKLEKDPAYKLGDAEQKTVMRFFDVVEKSIAFQKGEVTDLDFVKLAGVEI